MMTTRTRVRVNTAHVRRRYEAGRNKALDKAGSMVRQSAKRQFSRRMPKKRPTYTRVGTKDGMPVLAMDFRPPRGDRVTSWKIPGGRGAVSKGFLYTMIEYRRDDRAGSVVIGPVDKATWLNKLQEFGGSARRVLKLIGTFPSSTHKLLSKFPPPAAAVIGKGQQRRDSRGRFKTAAQLVGGGVLVGVWTDPRHSRRRGTVIADSPGRAKPGQFMKKGLAAKRNKIEEVFLGKISGP
jgi:hypothetical protein